MKAILLVAFGSAFVDGINNSIGLLEKDLREEFGREYIILTAFTSKRVITLLKERHDYYIPHITEALFNLANDGCEEVNIVPLHIIEGAGYDELIKIRDEYSYSFKKIRLLKTLLSSDEEDIELSVNKVVNAIKDDMEDGKILLAGHGSKNDSNEIYSKVNIQCNNIIGNRFYMATLEGDSKIEDVICNIKKNNVKKITIKPLIIIPGKHYIHDISDGESSWMGILISNGINATISKASLLQYKNVRKIYIDNINRKINS